MTEARPALNGEISANDFRSFYWLKEELLQFCRSEGISTQGSKKELESRIAHYLETGERGTAKTARPFSVMPQTLTLETLIGKGWRCNQTLRAFFQTEIGAHFHFNQVMRDFIAQGEGKTLRQAIVAWQHDQDHLLRKKSHPNLSTTALPVPITNNTRMHPVKTFWRLGK